MKHNIKMDNQQFVKENQKINNFPKNSAAHNLSGYYYYQEIFDFLTKKPGERYPKRLMEEIDKKKENWRNILEDKKKEFQKNYYHLKLSISKQLRNSKYLKI